MKQPTRATTVLRDDLTQLSETSEGRSSSELISENREIERYAGRLEDFERDNGVVFVGVNWEGLRALVESLDLLTGGGSSNDELILDDLVKAAIKMTGFEARR